MIVPWKMKTPLRQNLVSTKVDASMVPERAARSGNDEVDTSQRANLRHHTSPTLWQVVLELPYTVDSLPAPFSPQRVSFAM